MRSNKLEIVEHTANLPLQILLFLNVYAFLAWILIHTVVLWQEFSAHANETIVYRLLGFLAVALVETVRLYLGYNGNLRAQAEDLNIFLILAPLVQLPLMLFLLLSLQPAIIFVSVATYLLLFLMCLEFVVGIYAWRQLYRQQAKLYQMRVQANRRKTVVAEEHDGDDDDDDNNMETNSQRSKTN